MKTASFLVTAAGVVALVLGVVERILHRFILSVAPMSYLTLAATLFLLALVLIEFDRSYLSAEKKQ